jgi:hypothetical protein
MKTYIFLDLDDTILQTLPKCPPGAPVWPAAYRRDGSPLSYMTDQQRALFDLLTAAGTLIPTTARNLDAFRRVDLPFTHAAVLDFGGVILRPDRNPDPAWDAAVRPQAVGAAAALRAVQQSVQRFCDARGLGAVARVIADFDMPLYVVVKHPHGDAGTLQTIQDEHLPGLDLAGFRVHRNDNNLSLVPRFLGKERAVRHVIDHLLGPGPVLTVGVGDSLSDAAFLGVCDYCLLPRDCQLFAHTLGRLGGD